MNGRRALQSLLQLAPNVCFSLKSLVSPSKLFLETLLYEFVVRRNEITLSHIKIIFFLNRGSGQRAALGWALDLPVAFAHLSLELQAAPTGLGEQVLYLVQFSSFFHFNSCIFIPFRSRTIPRYMNIKIKIN